MTLERDAAGAELLDVAEPTHALVLGRAAARPERQTGRLCEPHVRALRVGEHEHLALGPVVEEAIEPLGLEQSSQERPVALPILNAVLASAVVFVEDEPIVGLGEACGGEHGGDDLGRGATLEHAAVLAQGEHVSGRRERDHEALHVGAGVALGRVAELEGAHDAVHVAPAAPVREPQRRALADHVRGRERLLGLDDHAELEQRRQRLACPSAPRRRGARPPSIVQTTEARRGPARAPRSQFGSSNRL